MWKKIALVGIFLVGFSLIGTSTLAGGTDEEKLMIEIWVKQKILFVNITGVSDPQRHLSEEWDKWVMITRKISEIVSVVQECEEFKEVKMVILMLDGEIGPIIQIKSQPPRAGFTHLKILLLIFRLLYNLLSS